MRRTQKVKQQLDYIVFRVCVSGHGYFIAKQMITNIITSKRIHVSVNDVVLDGELTNSIATYVRS